jgi:uncharacterized protein (TIGR02145 family)
MKKLFLFSFLLFTSSFLLFAQAPQGIPYQAIARNASGVAISNTAVKVRFSIRDSIATGAIKYQETHNPTTSALGLFSVNVGMGTVVSGTFSGINWGKNAKFLQVELNTTGGTTYTDLGTTQMMSVPYALSAATANTATTASNLTTTNTTYGLVSVYNCNGQIQLSPCLPQLITTVLSNITATSATCGGNITSTGGGSITARGVCWGTSQNPTTANSKTIDGSGIGSFTSSLSGLSSSRVYYVRAYATNSAGTSYGNQQILTTNSALIGVFNPNLTYGTMSDIDGNAYKTIQIGTQTWMAENLKTTKYRDGTIIPTGLSDAAWVAATTGAYSIYNNDAANNATYGKLYNWYAVADSRNLCPVGWHVPSGAEFVQLFGAYGPYTPYFDKLTSTSSLWLDANTATNESGFSGLPGGHRYDQYLFIGYRGTWWTSTYIDVYQTAQYVQLIFQEPNGPPLFSRDAVLPDGYSVRCLKD